MATDKIEFRQESLDSINSPEKLHSNFKVIHPSAWIGIIAVVILLTGFVIWSIFGTIITSYEVGGYVDNEIYYAYISTTRIDEVRAGDSLYIDDETGVTITNIATNPITVTEENVKNVKDLEVGELCYVAQASTAGTGITEGYHSSRIVTDVISPIEMLIN